MSPDHGHSLRLRFTTEQLLEFCESVSPNLSNYEGDGVSTSLFSAVFSELAIAQCYRPGRLFWTISYRGRRARQSIVGLNEPMSRRTSASLLSVLRSLFHHRHLYYKLTCQFYIASSLDRKAEPRRSIVSCGCYPVSSYDRNVLPDF